jgi:hypothetical protein
MSIERQSRISRRPLLIALGALVGFGAAGGLFYEATKPLRHRYTGPYAGLLSGLGNGNAAAVIGRAVLAQTGPFDPKQTARDLHDIIDHRPLAAILTREAGRGEVTEVQGWVLPETLTRLCALAAQPS